MMSKKPRFVSPSLVVHVTKEKILEGKMSDSGHCMISESVKVALMTAGIKYGPHVSTDLATIRFTNLGNGLRYTYFTPRNAQLALLNFDSGKLPEPFSFRLRTAGQIRRAGWAAAHPNMKPRKGQSNKSDRVELDQKLKTKKIRGSAIHGGRPFPRTGTRREFGLRAFIMGGSVGKGRDVAEK